MKKTALITGGSRGIGRAAVEIFARNGYQVMINYCSSRQEAGKLAARLSGEGLSVELFQADVSDFEQVNAMVQACKKVFGPVDVLVNNAGIAQQKLFSDISPAEWDRMFSVNVKGMFHSCRCVLDDMIHRKSGKIINVSSMWGITGASCEVHYSASKAAVIGFTKALAKELGPSNIQVNCVAPGVIGTDMLKDFSENDKKELAEETPLQRLGTPEDVAEAIYFLGSSRSDFFTGQILSPNGGFVI